MERPIHIAHVATNAPDPNAGAAHCYYGMETGLARRGYRCVHVAQRPASADVASGLEVVMAGSLPRLPGLKAADGPVQSVAFQFASARALRRMTNGSRPDLVVCYGCDTAGAADYAKRQGLPLVHFTFGSLADLMETYRMERRIWGPARLGYTRRAEAVMLPSLRFQAALERRIARQADLLIVPCRLRRAEVICNYGVPAEKVAVVPMGVNAGAYPPAADRARLRAEFGLAADDFVFLSVGQCIWRKGILWLFQALAGIRGQLPPRVKVALAGFHQRELIERLVHAHGLKNLVVCLGPQSHTRIRQLYAAADAFVLASVEEGFGLVILEALAAGLPLVSTKIGGAPDLLTDGEHALLVELRDPVGLGAALVRVAQEPALRDTLRAGGQAVAEQYSWDYTAAKLDEAYRTVLGDARGRSAVPAATGVAAAVPSGGRMPVTAGTSLLPGAARSVR